jgi:hypothetical protein
MQKSDLALRSIKRVFRFGYSIIPKVINISASHLFNSKHKRTITLNPIVTNRDLAALCDLYGSDKGSLSEKSDLYFWKPHTYTDFYEIIFSQVRLDNLNIFECGLGSIDPSVPSNMGVKGKPGSSLRVWRDFFPNAMIYGADIDPKTLFQENRIATIQMNQTERNSVNKAMASLNQKSFDIIIDDGLHTFFAGKCLFEFLYSFMTPNGTYVIEDVHQRDKNKFVAFFAKYSDLDITFVDFGKHGSLGSLIYIRKTIRILSTQ